MQKHGGFRFEVGRTGDFILDAVNQSETALSVAIPDLDQAVINVAEGRETLPKPAPVLKVVPAAPPAPTVSVFLSNPVKWMDADRQWQRAARYTVVALPPELAAMARELACTLPLDHPMVKTHGQPPGPPPEWHHCFDLMTGEKPAGTVYSDLPKEKYRPPANLQLTDHAADLRLPRAAARTEPEQHDGMFEERVGKPYQMTVKPRRFDDGEKQ
jgi:hypothetical protein